MNSLVSSLLDVGSDHTTSILELDEKKLKKGHRYTFSHPEILTVSKEDLEKASRSPSRGYSRGGSLMERNIKILEGQPDSREEDKSLHNLTITPSSSNNNSHTIDEGASKIV